MTTAMPLKTEQRPANPVPRGPRPGSRYPPYQVRDGDTWSTVAQKYSVEVSTLLMHNFATTNPNEINWYLREYVGCNVATNDRLNWCFSSSATPGLIYVPALGTRKPKEPVEGTPPGPVDPADEKSPVWLAASLGALEVYEGVGGGVVGLVFRNLSNKRNFYYAGLRGGPGFNLDPVEKIEKVKEILQVIGQALFFWKLRNTNWVPVTVYQPFSANGIDGCEIDCVAWTLKTGAPSGVQNHSFEQITMLDTGDYFGRVTFQGTSWWGIPEFSGEMSVGVLIRIW
jgi:hypothetical protein